MIRVHVFLHKFTAIQNNSLYLLYTGKLAELPTILDSVTSIANTTSTPIGWESGGGRKATQWQAKATASLKTGK